MTKRSRQWAAVAATWLALCGPAAAGAPEGILFSADAKVPPAVRAFAWRVIETRCDFQAHELAQRSFWAYDARTRDVDGTLVYSIRVLSELPWKKSDPPVTLDMVLADDGGRLVLTGLRSSFIRCRA
jgi:hypothetical protein